MGHIGLFLKRRKENENVVFIKWKKEEKNKSFFFACSFLHVSLENSDTFVR